MKLIKIIPLNFTNELIKQWEQECENVNRINAELIQKAPLIKVDAWEIYEIFLWGDMEGHISACPNIIKTQFEASLYGLDLQSFPICGEETLTSRHKFNGLNKKFVVKKVNIEIKSKVELLEIPEKPYINDLTRNKAYHVIRQLNPRVSYMQMYDSKNEEEQNYYYAKYCFPKIVFLETSKQEYSQTFVVNRRYLCNEYRVFFDRCEVWEYLYIRTTSHTADGNLRVISSSNYNPSTSIDCDGFWGKVD